MIAKSRPQVTRLPSWGIRAVLTLALAGLLSACRSTDQQMASLKPLPRAHSHNDYEQPRPLFEALDQGFCSVEADIFVVDGQLLVGHTKESLKPGLSLESLYLAPLRKRIKENRGRVYPSVATIHLLIDIKTDATATYQVLRRTLERYSDILTTYRGRKCEIKGRVGALTFSPARQTAKA